MADLDLRRLHLLRAVGRLGSLTSAAAALSFTTSAVSQQISKLEREMGVALVERHPRGVALTEAGVALLRYADEIDRTIEAAHAEMDEFAGLRRGQLRLGTFPTVGASLLPDVVLAFRARYPKVAITVVSARRAGLIERLKRRDIELTLLWDYPWERIEDDELATTPLVNDPTVLLVPHGHPLADGGPVSIGTLRDQEWIVRDEHPVADVLSRVCRHAGFEPRIAFAANDYQETQGMVAAGIASPSHPGSRSARCDPTSPSSRWRIPRRAGSFWRTSPTAGSVRPGSRPSSSSAPPQGPPRAGGPRSARRSQ
ncbi:LysR family transcriptional regulator [Sinomonas cyclohexanicum]|uniref:LysR family transcriptional regulator n=1 Tax=Sinomonas cyclohexanicum TaxID=322009 RepID=A0ABM7PR28_SINCY|nr:LysR substrate-binding domain-containing protein [Corynebacterium cyclohexanicum]BCT74655.1 LysR family transcriptional regulator [Corynebacterium cyclohexanicum]